MKQNPHAKCPFCGESNDASTPAIVGCAEPRAGDYSVCLYCGEAGVYEKDDGHLIIRKPNAKEWVAMMSDPDITNAQIAIANMNLGKKPKNEL